VVINNSEELNCENLISTMPVTKLIKMINPSKEIREISSRLKYRNVILVFLVLRKKKYCHDHWIYFPEKQIFSRLHEPKNWSEHMAPENETGICIEIFCSDKDPVWNMSNSKIIPQIIRELPFLDESSVTATLLKKVPYAYPIYDLYYKENLTKIHKSLLAYKNLYLLGRSGTFRYINMDTCIDDGLRLGRFLKLKQEKHSQNAEEISFFNKQ